MVAVFPTVMIVQVWQMASCISFHRNRKFGCLFRVVRGGSPQGSPRSGDILKSSSKIELHKPFEALQGGEMRTQKTLNLSRNTVSLKVVGRCFTFFTLRNQLVAQQKCCGLKKIVTKSRAQATLSNKFWLCCSFFLDPHKENQPMSELHFFNPQQVFLLRVKLITQG